MKSIGVTRGWVLFACLIGGWGAMFVSGALHGQEDSEANDEEMSSQVVAEDTQAASIDRGAQSIEEVVVTGSRLKRDTFSSIAPLQIITSEVSREAGLIDAADILQGSTTASGQQVDLTFQGFVLDNGPGASTINLRGLDPQRTLVLVNSRRMAPAGVEGAPTSPDLNLVPASLVQQYELLLDGASSIYGSDAVAGVVNAVLRKDFDGFEFETYSTVPTRDNGEEHLLSLTWGRNFDRGHVGVAVEYTESDPVTFDDRPWTSGCLRHAEIDETGRIRTLDISEQVNFGMKTTDCVSQSWVARVFQDDPRLGTGSIYYTPGYSNGGWKNFSEGSTPWFGVDGDGDGETDLSYIDYSLNGKEQFRYLYPDFKQASVMSYGEYTFEGEMNLTPYYEVLWSERNVFNNTGAATIAPDVPANNPFNLCNPATENGVDCGEAQSALYTNPNVVKAFAERWGAFCAAQGLSPENCLVAFDFVPGPIGAVPTNPILAVQGDRNNADVNLWQGRLVVGATADLPFVNFAGTRDWSMDVSLSYSKSSGTASRVGIRDDRLNLALGNYSSTDTPCQNDTDEALADDAAVGCVPVNLFAPSLYPLDTLIGDFATAVERNYLMDSRDFKTEYEQTVLTGFVTGTAFDLPGGPVDIGIGLEWRKDEINSLPDHIAAQGLMYGYFSDGGAVGDKITKEAFFEAEFPILAGITLIEELTLNLSARLTDDEFYGSALTESVKLAYRPFSSLLVRSTYGTSYRAPNLREIFLQYQTGFLTLFDPCLIPEAAIDELSGGYNPEKDEREAQVLENCRANGVDPTVANNNGNNSYDVELAETGSLDIDEETSRSWTAGFSWEQPFTNEFEFAAGATYYNIEVRDTIVKPGGQFTIYDCYLSLTGLSPFCDNIRRDLSDPTKPFIEFIDLAYANRDTDEVTGIDINATLSDTLTVFERPFEIHLDFAAHRLLEVYTFDDATGTPEEQFYEGEWQFPDWKYQIGVRVDWDKWRFSWQTNYIDGMRVDSEGADPLAALGSGSHTCLGPPDDVLCQDIGWASDYLLHSASINYFGDIWQIGLGVRNVFDQAPPFVDGTEVFSIHNTPLGAGYDLNGRRVFLSLQVNLGGGE